MLRECVHSVESNQQHRQAAQPGAARGKVVAPKAARRCGEGPAWLVVCGVVLSVKGSALLCQD